MTDPETSRIDLAQVLERFPADARLITRLAANDESFVSMCEDYSLASARLAQLLISSRVATGTEVAEYRDLVSDLEREIEVALCNAR